MPFLTPNLGEFGPIAPRDRHGSEQLLGLEAVGKDDHIGWEGLAILSLNLARTDNRQRRGLQELYSLVMEYAEVSVIQDRPLSPEVEIWDQDVVIL